MLPIKSTLSIQNTLFSNNDGAVALLSGVNGAADGLIRNCTFYNNGEFPIIKNWGSNFNYTTFYNRMEVANSVIWEPEAIPGRLFYNNSLANPSLHDYNLHHNLISAPDCNLPGGDVACGAGNIFATWPAFLDTLNGDFRVSACSPAINAGTNEGLADTLTDLDGNPRILDSLADMGAYERYAYRVDSVAAAGVSCSGGSDGSVLMGLIGNTPYQYDWQTTTGQTGEGHENLPAGNYHFSITDAMGCSDTISAVLSQPEAIEASFVVANASAFNVADGSILLDQISGGTPPYRFLWNTGDTSTSLSGLAPGLYELAILDANDCEHLLNVEVSFINATGLLADTWKLRVAPNPVQGRKRLRVWQKGEAIHESVISLWDAQGRRVQQFLMNGADAVIDTAPLPAGVYWLRWQRSDGHSGGGVKVVVL
ncbi:MAG: T9SS type A sorting domain-containing protein [Saprospiraceae bacterium]|nr:T9SS type A sorting domain-containing protein [Saprospiraceae bacterium]